MKKLPLITGILSLILAVIVFVFADGARRIYSGALFMIFGFLQLYAAWRSGRQPDER